LKRFASIQDFLASKIFSLLLEIAGINNTKMSEVLSNIEKENIIDSLESWIELQEALNDLKYCIDNFEKIQSYYLNSLNFFKKYSV